MLNQLIFTKHFPNKRQAVALTAVVCKQLPVAGKFESRKASPVCHDTRHSLVKLHGKKDWGNGRMQFILLKLDSASFVTLSDCHCRWFLSCYLLYLLLRLLFCPCYLYTSHSFTEGFWNCAFISIAFFTICRSGNPAVLPLAEKGRNDFLWSWNIPLLLLLVCSPSFCTLLFYCLYPFSSTVSRVVLLFLLSTSVFQQE